MTDSVNSPAHYNSRTVQCIEFTRHLDFALGNAFKYFWREGMKSEADTNEDAKKAHWYIKDALVHRPVWLSEGAYERLARQLTLLADEFAPQTFQRLLAILTAARGEYGMLLALAKDEQILGDNAHTLTFGEAKAA